MTDKGFGARFGPDPTSQPGAENPRGEAGGMRGPRVPQNGAQTGDMFKQAANAKDQDATEWRESGRQTLADWFAAPPPPIPTDKNWIMTPNVERGDALSDMLDVLYVQARRGSIQAATRLLEYRIGRPHQSSSTKQTVIGDGVALDDAAKDMTAGIREELERAGVDTSLIDKATDDYVWGDKRAEEHPAAES